MKLSKQLTLAIKQRYHQVAHQEFDEYLGLSEIAEMAPHERQECQNKIYELVCRYLTVDDNKITTESLRLILKKLGKGFEEYRLQSNLLQLLLAIIEQEIKISSGPLPHIVQLKQEEPILTPEQLLNSELHQKLYQWLESTNTMLAYLKSPQTNWGVLIVWLVLKEGLNKQTLIKQLLSDVDCLTHIDNHWFFQSGTRRYWLSPKAELLLMTFFQAKLALPNNLLNGVNKILKQDRLLSPLVELRFSDLNRAAKEEFILSVNVLEYGLSTYQHKTTHLSTATLFRLMTGHQVSIATDTVHEHVITERQKRAWNSAHATTAPQLRRRPNQALTDITVQQQLYLIDDYVKILDTLAGQSKRNPSTTVLRDKLRVQLEYAGFAQSHPWCWLLLGWFYQLLSKGGKVKSKLKLNTIKAYINYVSEPFLTEFSCCSIEYLTPLEWAEKLNMAAEQISAPTKKAYLLYFAEFLIDSQICNGMCLSDLDIPTQSAQVSANIITIAEAERIEITLEKLGPMRGKIARLVFCLGFYSGLRRGEVSGLQFKDFHYNESLDYFSLHVRPNYYRTLKSSHSARNLPLDVLWTLAHRQQLKDYLLLSKRKFVKSNSLIFADEQQLNQAFDDVTAILQQELGDHRLRYHHLRHSFCNWTWLRLHDDLSPQHERKPYPFLQADYFNELHCQSLQKRLGVDVYSRNRMWALAELLGHATPSTTMSSYLHIVEFIRRARFSQHEPTPSELRIFWGQHLSFDEWGRVRITPKLADKYQQLLPKAMEFTPVLKSNQRQLQSAADKTHTVVDLELCWRIIRRLGEGHSVQEISDVLVVPETTIDTILQLDQNIRERSLKKSKYQLFGLINYDKLNQKNVSALEKVIKRYQYASQQSAFEQLEIKYISLLIDDLVGGKDSLIRSSNKKAVLTLIRLLNLMKVDPKLVEVKWYYPRLEDFEEHRTSEYLTDFEYWQNKLINEGLIKSNITGIIPHGLSTYVVLNDAMKSSDEGRFLPYRHRGYVSVHVLEQYRHIDEEGSVQITSSRTRAFISFLRLLTIYIELDSLIKFSSSLNDS